uniref:Uncharacterized protein n=1 Tax=Rhizophora mucronata TaxID=61149 RepID=A0A2P2IPS6_RHIMU
MRFWFDFLKCELFWVGFLLLTVSSVKFLERKKAVNYIL